MILVTNKEINVMKIAIITLSLVLVSCASHRERKAAQVVEEPETEVVSQGRPQKGEPVDNTIYGTVELSKDACDVLINTREGDIVFSIYPIGLSDKYKIEGLKMTFNYNLSRAQSPDGCNATKIAVLTDIKVQ
ncbi:MAG: hypothetical protein ACI9XP_000811 [Lentimonas sp.]|jgi:hypothetical protein